MRSSIYLAALLVLVSPALSLASETQGGLIVIDGDTMKLNGERIRLRSEAGPIDAPELRKAQCPLELYRAEAARDRLKALVAAGAVTIRRTGADRYGRTVAVVFVDGRDVGALLVREGHAKPWPTLRRADRPTWCGPE
ncbi:hypothetical protein GCM10008171_33310 [Methylopila jiangsuensis]|uniref:TNase-like domain-containing protein n=1 Tax=Methylopila jiangsuensis TaxID=586230 RepID=A0A9W6JIY8_9HYPH|nr:thermonuclease family protein [Methylopila jiangsuensis]MDR6284535.1 endonuclease YncB(thermonuclease family) [Methylopila jiangsuensis]GLK78077.1 hypothetical protein GCM10008171_33310 [Methylopila jiangsuensis]